MKCVYKGKEYTLLEKNFKYGYAQIKGENSVSIYVPIAEVKNEIDD